MAKTEEQLREDIVQVGRLVFDKGWVAANDGNITVRVSENEVLCTPTMHCKGFLKPEWSAAAFRNAALLWGRPAPDPDKDPAGYAAAFERRYGYSGSEVLGRAVHELHMSCNPADRRFVTEQLRQGLALRNKITWLRAKSGEIKLTTYSADRIRFDGQPCVLAVSEDLPGFDQKKAN